MNGAQLRDEGMVRAAEHADRLHAAWQDRAMGFLKEFIASANRHDAHYFSAEEVYAFAERRGLPKPPDRRAWGVVMVRAVKAGIVCKRGYSVSERPECHRRPVTMWGKA